ncbi:MAG: LemA family protein [Rhodoluna sp.]
MLEILLVVLAVVVIGGIWFVAMRNGLVRLNVRVDEAWSDITVQLKRRADLIPNLIEAVKGYAKHEAQVFENVTKARAATISGAALADPAQAAEAENMLQGALKSLFAVAEAYPVLQASQNFLNLQTELSDTEDKIMAARRFYNGGVRELNTKIQVWPNSFFAKSLGFVERAFYEVADLATIQNAPQVKF